LIHKENEQIVQTSYLFDEQCDSLGD